MQINKNNILNNNKIVDHDYKVGDKVTIGNHVAYKYETPYKGPFLIIQCWANVAVTLQCGAKKKYNIQHINPHTY